MLSHCSVLGLPGFVTVTGIVPGLAMADAGIGNQLVRGQESSGLLHAVKVHGRAGSKAAPIDR